jgi:hypothetical protein
MPAYRIFRIKETPRQQFRWAPHVSGATWVKPRDYEEDRTVEAPGVYAAWASLRQTAGALRVGDLLAAEDGALHIVKYVGFEEARWALAEGKPDEGPPVPGEAGPAAGPDPSIN